MHPLISQKNILPQCLAEEKFLMREPCSGIRLATKEFFAERGLKLKVRVEVGSTCNK